MPQWRGRAKSMICARAATEFKSDHYMGDVARVHAAVLKAKGAGKTP